MKHDISKHPHWTHDQFIAFLLYHAAQADMEFIDEEREMILKNISVAQLGLIQKEYRSLSDFERINVIQAYKEKYYSTASQKKEIIDKVKQLCNADGEYDVMEKNMVMMLKKLL